MMSELWSHQLGDVCAGRPEIFQPETMTGQHMIADPTKKSVTKLPLDVSCLHKLHYHSGGILCP